MRHCACLIHSCALLLRSRPTCHRIRRTVIDTVKGSCSFSFFPLPPSTSTHAPAFRPLNFIISSRLRPMTSSLSLWTYTSKSPSHTLPHGQPHFLVIFIPSPLMSL